MKPYGRIKKVMAFKSKRSIFKINNWWEEINTIVPRSRMKQKWKNEMKKDTDSNDITEF